MNSLFMSYYMHGLNLLERFKSWRYARNENILHKQNTEYILFLLIPLSLLLLMENRIQPRMYSFCWFFLLMQVTSPSGNVVHTMKGTAGDKFEFKAPRSGMFNFCFHNPHSSPETVSFYIHIGHISNEHDLAKDGLSSLL